MTTVIDLPEFFDEHRPCPKCWWSPVIVRHCARRTPEYPLGSHPYTPCDHLHRACGRCGYEWIELPMDAARAPVWTAERWSAGQERLLRERREIVESMR